MCDFKPGDEVEWTGVPNDFQPERRRAGPGDWWPFKRGVVYVVAQTVLVRGEVGLVISGFKSPHPTGAVLHVGFRKVQRRYLQSWLNTSVPNTDHLDKPLPAKKRERVE